MPRHSQGFRTSAERKGGKMEAMKYLKGWNLRFSGEDRNEDPEQFLDKLEDCIDGSDVLEKDFLRALPCVFIKSADHWFRTMRPNLHTWTEFRRAFRRRFVMEYDHEDLMAELRQRTQAKGEKITEYLSSVRLILSKFSMPPASQTVLEMTWRNLLPEYRRAMRDTLVNSLEDIENYGRRWERQKELDGRYLPPPPPEKMKVPAAAYRGSVTKSKVAAIEEDGGSSEEEAEAVAAVQSEDRRGNRKKGKRPNTKPAAAPKAEPTQSTTTHTRSSSELRGGEFVDALTVAHLPKSFTPAAFSLPNCSTSGPIPQQWGPLNAVYYIPSTMPQQWIVGQQPSQASTEQLKRSQSLAFQKPGNTQHQSGRSTPTMENKPPPRSNSPAVSNSSDSGLKYVGPCYVCNCVGHRAADCPETTCHFCHQRGHQVKGCPKRLASAAESCQGCNAPNVTVRKCPRCAPLLQQPGNGATGGQKD